MQPRGPSVQRSTQPNPELTKTERSVLNLLLARPLDTNQALADALGCSVKTVEFHLSNVFRKTGVASRMELVVKLLCGRPPAEGAKNGG